MRKNVTQYLRTVQGTKRVSFPPILSREFTTLVNNGSPFHSPNLARFADMLGLSVEDIMTCGGEPFHRFEESVPDDRYCNFIVGNNAKTGEEIEQLKEIKKCGYYKDVTLSDPRSGSREYKFCLTDEFFETVACDDRVSEAAFDYLLQPYGEGTTVGVWYAGFPYMIHWCYLYCNIGRLNKLLAAAEKNNSTAIDRRVRVDLRNYGGNGMGYKDSPYRVNGRYGVVRIMGPTILIAMERGDADFAERLNKINSNIPTDGGLGNPYVANSRDLYLLKIRSDKKLSDTDRMVAECVYDGILNVDELLKNTSDYDVVKAALDKYPLTKRELMEKYIDSGDWRNLFRYSFTIDDPVLSSGLIACAVAEDGAGYLGKYDEAWRKKNPQLRYSAKPNITEKPAKSRESILEGLALKAKLSETTDSLTPDYFDRQLSMGNYDMVIIKLCVRLESVLKYKYKYEGDFSEMLNEYCKRNDSEKARLFQKLRLCRNAIVHPDQTTETMNVDQLKRCIKYVCDLG